MDSFRRKVLAVLVDGFICASLTFNVAVQCSLAIYFWVTGFGVRVVPFATGRLGIGKAAVGHYDDFASACHDVGVTAVLGYVQNKSLKSAW